MEASRIFYSLDTIVEIANATNSSSSNSSGLVEVDTEQSFEQAVEKLKNLIVEKENIKIYLESVR